MENRFFMAQHKTEPNRYLKYVQFRNQRVGKLEFTSNLEDATYVDDSFFRRATPENIVRAELTLYNIELVPHPVINKDNWYEKTMKGINK